MEISNDAQDRKRLFRQTLIVWFLSMVAIRIFYEMQRLPSLADLSTILTAAVLIYLPIYIYHRRKERGVFFEANVQQVIKSIGWFLAVSIVIFPIIEIGNRYYQEIIFNRHYIGGNYKDLLQFAFFQLVVIAIPEEIFYRGYIQPQLNRLWGRPWKFLGAPIGKSLFFTSFLFAFSHSLVQLQWWHFSIFFPSLVFGWLRERTGAVTAGSLFHAASNVYSFWMINNYG